MIKNSRIRAKLIIFYASKLKEFYYLLLLTIGLSYLFIKWLTAALFKET